MLIALTCCWCTFPLALWIRHKVLYSCRKALCLFLFLHRISTVRIYIYFQQGKSVTVNLIRPVRQQRRRDATPHAASTRPPTPRSSRRSVTFHTNPTQRYFITTPQDVHVQTSRYCVHIHDPYRFLPNAVCERDKIPKRQKQTSDLCLKSFAFIGCFVWNKVLSFSSNTTDWTA